MFIRMKQHKKKKKTQHKKTATEAFLATSSCTLFYGTALKSLMG